MPSRPDHPALVSTVGRAVLVVAFLTWWAMACSWPSRARILDAEGTMLVAPRTRLHAALHTALERHQVPAPHRAVLADGGADGPLLQSRAVDLTLIAEALGLPGDRLDTLLAEPTRDRQTPEVTALRRYAQLRDAVLEHRRWRRDAAQRTRWGGRATPARPPVPAETAIPDALPPQHRLYMAGLLAHERGETEVAVDRWTALLQLPPMERRERTAWATFQLGRTLETARPEEAVEWFQRTRAEVADGTPDPLGLAAASLGYEARVALHSGALRTALLRYAAQLASGDPGAMQSIRVTVNAVLDGAPEQQAAIAGDPLTCSLVNATLAVGTSRWARPDDRLPGWLDRMEQHAGMRDAGAAELALAVYRSGDDDAARRWAEAAGDLDPLGLWIRAKCAVRDGDLDDADRLLSAALGLDSASISQPLDQEAARRMSLERRLFAELGAIRLARGRFLESLHCFLRGDFLVDAAYVAERVVTLSELEGYVDRTWPTPSPDPPAANPEDPRVDPGRWIRDLLARRLARSGSWGPAGDYFTPSKRADAMRLRRALAASRDERRPRRARAESMWRAAVLLRHKGIQLTGTLTGPDGGLSNGAFPALSADLWHDARAQNRVVPATEAELARLESHPVFPERRWHYRYVAADLAYEASRLLEDDDPELPFLLCRAGDWLRIDDPQEADRFYKDLVNRCRPHPLAVEADRRRWFPHCDRDPFTTDEQSADD